jgi:hypothetical protein
MDAAVVAAICAAGIWVAIKQSETQELPRGLTHPVACHEGPRLYEVDRAAYERQARRVFAAADIPFSDRAGYELDHRIPRCLGGQDTDDNLVPQPLAEADVKDELEREVCRRVCGRRPTMAVEAAWRLGDSWRNWRAGYRQVFGREPPDD